MTGSGEARSRHVWLSELEGALTVAEALTLQLAAARDACAETAMLLAQIQLARATLEELRHAEFDADHPDWVEIFRSIAELSDGRSKPLR